MRTNFAIFLMFFGIALLDALRGGHWLRVILWLGVAAVFYWADVRRRAPKK
jgi:hypothetical protein